MLRSGATSFEYERDVQPRPKLGRWTIDLENALAANGAKPAREQLTLIRIFEELRGRGYDAVRRYARRWAKQHGQATAAAYVPLSFASGEAYPKKGCAQSKTASRRKVTSPAANAKKPTRSVESKAERVAAAKTLRKADEPRAERVTKQERVLTLLSQPEGASIDEMMRATDWQQHSVRGFLAGTVKKKLGFPLTSLKPNGGVRRYRIETRRAR